MTIQMLATWNGLETGAIVSTLGSTEESRLIDAKLARAYTPGMDGKSSPVQGDGIFDWYVDSVAGNDANSGTRPESAKRTLASLGTVAANKRVGLARGSHFRGQLVSGNTGIVVGAYGTGVPPIIDGADPVAPSEWVPTSGQAGVFEITRLSQDVFGSEHPSLWTSTGMAGTRAASLAACQATAGSFFQNFTSGGVGTSYKIYLHPAGDLDPRTNGITYFAGARLYGINLLSGTVTDVITRRQLHHDGSIRAAGNGSTNAPTTLRRCVSQGGYQHDVYISSGIVEDCSNADTEISGGSLVYQPTAAGGALEISGFGSTYAVPTTGSAIFAHLKNNSSLLIKKAESQGSESLFASADCRGKIVIVDGRHQIGAAGIGRRSIELLQQFDPGPADIFLIRPRSIANHLLYLQNLDPACRVFVWEPMGVSSVYTAYAVQCTELHIIGGMLYGGSACLSLADGAGRAAVTVRHTVMQCPANQYFIFASGGTYSINRNVYWAPGQPVAGLRFNYNAANTFGTAWTALGFDANSSLAVDPLLSVSPATVTTLAGIDSMLDSSGALALSSQSSPVVTVGAGPGRVPAEYVFPAWVPADVRALCGRA